MVEELSASEGTGEPLRALLSSAPAALAAPPPTASGLFAPDGTAAAAKTRPANEGRAVEGVRASRLCELRAATSLLSSRMLVSPNTRVPGRGARGSEGGGGRAGTCEMPGGGVPPPQREPAVLGGGGLTPQGESAVLGGGSVERKIPKKSK